MSDQDKDRLRRAAEIIRQVMHPLDRGVRVCECCGATRATDGECRAQWEILNAALSRVEKVADWTPWEGRTVGPAGGGR